MKGLYSQKMTASRDAEIGIARALYGVALTLLLIVLATLQMIKTLADEVSEASRKRTTIREEKTVTAAATAVPVPVEKKHQDNTASMNPDIGTPTSSMDHVAMGYPVLRMMLPTPNSMGAPFFDGKNVTEFLENLSDMYDDAGIKDEDQKVKRLARYCGPTVGPWVKTLIEYDERNWEGLKAVLLQQFKDTDDAQIRNSTGFLEQLMKRPRGDGDDLALYCRQFQASSRKLVKAGRLSQLQECEWFVTGLPVRMRAKAAKIARILDDESTPDMAAVVKYVFEEQRSQRKVSELGRRVDVSHLIEEPKLRKDGGSSGERKAENAPLVRDGAIVAPTVAVPAVAVDADSLIEKFGQLSINSANATAQAITELASAIKQQQGRPATTYQMRPGYLDPAKSRNGAPLPADLSDKDSRETWMEYFRRKNLCNFCEEAGHHGNRCPTSFRLEEEGRIHRNEQGKWCGGPKGSQNPPFSVYGVQGGLLRVINQYLNTVTKESDLQNVGGISSLYLNIEDTDEECDDPALFGVAASQVAPASRGAASRSTLSGRVEKERRLPAARAQRRGAYVATGGERTAREEDSQETVQNMEDVRPTAAPEVRGNTNPRVRRARFEIPEGPQKLERIIRGSSQQVGKLAELVLKAPVGGSTELTVEDVLAGSAETRMLIFSKKRWEAGEEGRAVLAGAATNAANLEVANVNFIGEDAIHVTRTPTSSEPTPIFGVEVAGQRLLALYDTGSMVNVVSRSLAEDLKLKVQPIKRVTISSWTGAVNSVTGYIKNLVVGIKGTPQDEEAEAARGRIRVPGMVFVTEGMDKRYDLILGQPFRKTSRSGVGYDERDEDVLFFTDPVTRGEIAVRPKFLEEDSDDDDDGDGDEQQEGLNVSAN